MDFWIVPAWSLKNKEVFWMGLVNCPWWTLKRKEVFRIGLVDHPRVLFRIGPTLSLKNGEVF